MFDLNFSHLNNLFKINPLKLTITSKGIKISNCKSYLNGFSLLADKIGQ